MSERGPKGDHGQHGDEGTAGARGDTGLAGAPGAPGTPGAAGAAGGVGERGRPGDVGQTGETGKEGRRGRSNWQAYMMMGLAMLAALTVFLILDEQRQEDTAKAVAANERAIEAIEREGRERRDQTCRIFESQHLTNVTRLKRTYMFLEQVPRSEWGSTLVVAAVDGLPALETEARIDQAPQYCDEPGEAQERLYRRSDGEEGQPPVGLPEPDPEIPERKSFARLARP